MSTPSVRPSTHIGGVASIVVFFHYICREMQQSLSHASVQKMSSTNFGELSSLRAKRAGPKGLRAESARAVTGRRCPHSGKGEDFLTGQLNFFTETAVTPERKVKKSFPRWEINHHAEC